MSGHEWQPGDPLYDVFGGESVHTIRAMLQITAPPGTLDLDDRFIPDAAQWPEPLRHHDLDKWRVPDA